MAHIDVPPGDGPERRRMLAMFPPVKRVADAFGTAMYEEATLSLREREVARMRIAEINECPI